MRASASLGSADRRSRRRRRRLVLHVLPAVPLPAESHSGLSVHRQPRFRGNRRPRRPRAGARQFLPARADGDRRGHGQGVAGSRACSIACASARDVELICLDTSKEHFFARGRLFEHPEHQAFLEESLQIAEDDRVRWRIPFCHHPPYSRGPAASQHRRHASAGARVSASARVRAMFSGHEHNFQHSHADGIDYFVTGAAGKLRRGRPNAFEEARHGLVERHAAFPARDDRRHAHDRTRDRRARRRPSCPTSRADRPTDEFLAGPIEIDYVCIERASFAPRDRRRARRAPRGVLLAPACARPRTDGG